MNDNHQKTASNEQQKHFATGGGLPQKQGIKRTNYQETQTDTLHDQLMHWQDLEERATHCPEGLTPLDCQHLADYRALYSDYQYRIAGQIRAEQKAGK